LIARVADAGTAGATPSAVGVVLTA
jgi:hypothetical protein